MKKSLSKIVFSCLISVLFCSCVWIPESGEVDIYSKKDYKDFSQLNDPIILANDVKEVFELYGIKNFQYSVKYLGYKVEFYDWETDSVFDYVYVPETTCRNSIYFQPFFKSENGYDSVFILEYDDKSCVINSNGTSERYGPNESSNIGHFTSDYIKDSSGNYYVSYREAENSNYCIAKVDMNELAQYKTISSDPILTLDRYDGCTFDETTNKWSGNNYYELVGIIDDNFFYSKTSYDYENNRTDKVCVYNTTTKETKYIDSVVDFTSPCNILFFRTNDKNYVSYNQHSYKGEGLKIYSMSDDFVVSEEPIATKDLKWASVDCTVRSNKIYYLTEDTFFYYDLNTNTFCEVSK